MRFKSFVFLFFFSFVLPGFPATSQQADSGSSTLGKPSVKFKSWKVGRSDVGTDSTSQEQKSFITSTEEVCYFTASVGYDGTQGDNVSPIDPSKVTWSVEKPSHGMALDGELKTNWSGGSHPSKLNPSTSFNVVGKLRVPQHIGTSKSHCPNYNGTNTPRNGRNDDPMTFTLKFSATTEDGQAITPVELVLLQDEKDEMRQEYMDMARQTRLDTKKKVDGNVLRVPARTEFKGSDSYDDGHYSYMMKTGVSLAQKETDWEKALKTYAETDLKRTNVAAFDLTETGGYRNPHHHYYHVPNGSSSARSWHQFGVALDVRGRDIDMNGDKQRGTRADREDMEDAAKKYAGASWTSSNYSDGHVHAQWTGGTSNKERASTASPFSLPRAGTDTALTTAPGAPNAPRVACLGGCGDKIPASSQATYHLKEDCIGCGGDYYTCDESEDHAIVHNLYAPESMKCGHLYWTCNKGDCGQKMASCEKNTRCGARDFWKCQHTICYAGSPLPESPNPTPTTRPCGHPQSATGDHSLQASCSQTNSTGDRCTVSSFYACQSHTHTYPTPTTPTTTPTTPTTPSTPNPDDDDDDDAPSAPTTPTTPVTPPPRPPVTYHPCGFHPTTHRGDHTLQASCSEDSRCIATSFYYCQHYSHTYPAAPTLHPCGVHDISASGNHSLQASCSRDINCIAWSFYYCQHTSHTYPVPPPVVKCGNKWKGDGKCQYNRVVSSSSTEHLATCSVHGAYWGCNVGAATYHQSSGRRPHPLGWGGMPASFFS